MKQGSCKHKKGENTGIRNLFSEKQRSKNPEEKDLKSRIVIHFRAQSWMEC